MNLDHICDSFWVPNGDEELVRNQLNLVIDEITPDSKDLLNIAKVVTVIQEGIDSSEKLNEHQIRLLKGFAMIVRNVSVMCKYSVDELVNFKSVLSRVALTFINLTNPHSIQLSSLASMSILNFPQLMNFEPVGIRYDLDAFKVISILIDNYGLQSINIQALYHLLPLYITKDHDDLRIDLFYHGKQEFTMLLLSLCRAASIHPGMDLNSFLKDDSADVVQIRKLLLTIVDELYNHESFGGILCQIEKNQYTPNPDETVESSSLPLIFLIQSCCTYNMNDLTDLDLLPLAAWTIEYFKLIKDKCQPLLKAPILNEEEQILLGYHHRKMIAVLDIMSTFLEMNIVIQTFDEYKLIDEIIDIFATIEFNTLKPKLKDNVQNVKPGHMIQDKKQFPGVKSILIEIITALVHIKKSNQDRVRELNGIELILNNCNLDTNEPFIKERSILCIKYLLLENSENQNFISQLDIKGTEITKETDEVLQKAGYEVEIVNGKVGLKKSKDRQNVESKVL